MFELGWFWAGFATCAFVMILIGVITSKVAEFCGLKRIQKTLDETKALIKERQELAEKHEKELKGAWEDLKKAKDDLRKQQKKVMGFAKTLEARAQELGYLGPESWQADDGDDDE